MTRGSGNNWNGGKWRVAGGVPRRLAYPFEDARRVFSLSHFSNLLIFDSTVLFIARLFPENLSRPRSRDRRYYRPISWNCAAVRAQAEFLLCFYGCSGEKQRERKRRVEEKRWWTAPK